MKTKNVRNEDLKVGDFVVVIGHAARVLEIKPYVGPHRDIIFATAECVPKSSSFSLEIGGYSDIVEGGA